MNTPLSICFVTTFYPPANFGGDGIHIQRLAAALGRRGHQVTVVHSRDAYDALRPRRARAEPPPSPEPPVPNVTVHGLASPWGRLDLLLVHQLGVPALQRQRLKRLLGGSSSRGHDVIHFHNVSLIGGVGIFEFGQGVKLYTAHEYWLACPTHLLYRYNREICRHRTCIRCTLPFRRPPQWWRYTSLLDRQLSHLSAIICPSRLTQSVYRELNISRPTVVLPHFLPDAYLAEAEALGPRDRRAERYCLYVGRLDPVKGLQDILPLFASGEAGLSLVIAGRGPQERQLRDRFAATEYVRFIGFQDGDHLGRLYRDAVALILPSAGYEVFGQVILEAFAHSTPALVSDVGAGRELLEASGAGFVYRGPAQLRAALQRLTADLNLRDRLGQTGRRYATQTHSEGEYVRRYEALVDDVRRRCGKYPS
jgi:glycosyltransferase involved in cell wall biosynthesis